MEGKYAGLDYSYNFYSKGKEAASVEHKKQQYNPYMNNMGTVLGKLDLI